MATKICFTGKFKITCEYGRKGNLWSSGIHAGTDLVGITSDKVYSICNGIVERAGYDNGGFGNYVRIKEDGTENRIYLAHLSKIYVKVGQRVTYTTVIGLMGATGNVTGPHTHVEIREFKNGVAVRKLNASNYMGIPNKVGEYNSADYQINTHANSPTTPVKPQTPMLKTLARSTNLRSAPTTKGSSATLYVANTTLYVLESGVANADGYVWDKVRIRVNGKEGYMINKNYK